MSETSASAAEDPATLERGLSDLQRALAAAPASEKAEYVDALEKCPQLFQSECDPVAFLLREDWNAELACKRLCCYWRIRKEVFQERAYYPLKPGADGALYPEDVDILLTGYCAVLPTTLSGQSVAVMDFSRLVSNTRPSLESRIRVGFYMASLMMSRKSSTDGIVILTLLDKLSAFSARGRSARPTEVAWSAFPLRLKRMYFTRAPDETSRSGFFSSLLPMALGFLGSLFSSKVATVFGETQDQVLQSLLDEGLEPASLPRKIGGTFDYQDVFEPLITQQQQCTLKSPNRQEPSAAVEGDDPEGLLRRLDNALVLLPSNVPGLSAYREARHRVLLSVLSESPPQRFMQAENNDTAQAAKRLVAYWHMRQEAFEERAFLPLTLSERDALVKEDVAILSRGVVCVLPEDCLGRPVVCVDYARVDGCTGRKAPLRVFLYCLQVVSEHPLAHRQGLTLLIIISDQTTTSEILPFGQVLETLPVRLHLAHIVCPSESVGSSVGSQCVNALGPVANGKTLLLTPERQRSTVSRLQAFGLHLEAIPESIGGMWRPLIEIPIWMYSRLESERRKLSERAYGDDFENLEEPNCSVQVDLQKPTARLTDTDQSSQPACLIPDAITSTITETPTVISKGLAELEDAISLLPEDEKGCLLEARQAVPELAAKEAPPIRFLRVERFDVWRAASHLATYWRKRREIFGERWLLEMNQSGEGALSRDDIAVLSGGYAAILHYDRSGRTVVCYDLSRLTERSRIARLRVTFYLWNVVSENEKSQTLGAMVIIVARSVRRDPVTDEGVKLTLEALPVVVPGGIMVNVPAESERTTFQESIAPLFLKMLGYVAKTITIVVADTKVEMVKRLEQFGLGPESIPETIGGTFCYEEFARWQEMRTRYEWQLPSIGGSPVPHVPHYIVKPRSNLNDDEKMERRRRLNVLNSRRKRERMRVEQAVVNSQIMELRKRNRFLRQDNERLEALLQSAVATIRASGACVPSSVSASATVLPVTGPLHPGLADSSVVPLSSAFQPPLANGSHCVAPQNIIERVLQLQSGGGHTALSNGNARNMGSVFFQSNPNESRPLTRPPSSRTPQVPVSSQDISRDQFHRQGQDASHTQLDSAPDLPLTASYLALLERSRSSSWQS